MTATANVKNINVYVTTSQSFDVYLDYSLPTFKGASETISFSMDTIGQPKHASVALLSDYEIVTLGTMDTSTLLELSYTII